MTKKNKNQTEDQYYDENDDPTAALGNLDFNVEDEYKADPLIPKGFYRAAVTNVTYNPAQSCIVWELTLHDNGGLMNDGESPVDGAKVWYRNWLPKPGDENTPTTSGKTNKRQSKINMLKQFADTLGIDMSTPDVIATAISEAEWLGLEVDIDVDIREWEGKFSNEAKKVLKSKMF